MDQSEDISAIKEAMRTGFLKLDARMREIPEVSSLMKIFRWNYFPDG